MSEEFLAPDEKELIISGLAWLNKNFKFRDDAYDKKTGNMKADSNAVLYAENELRVIARIKTFIAESEQNLQWLHDYLLSEKLEQDIFLMFFKLWSKVYREKHPIKVV